MPPPMQPVATSHSVGHEELAYPMSAQYGQLAQDMKWYAHPAPASIDNHAQETNAHMSVIQPSSKLMSLHGNGYNLGMNIFN